MNDPPTDQLGFAFDHHDGVWVRDHRDLSFCCFNILGCEGILNRFQLGWVTIDLKRIAFSLNIFSTGIQGCFYNGILAAVPFVDVVTTMLDDSIPLTTNEYEEWGNPNQKKFYLYMKSYSPYDNVQKKSYPNLLITTGFHDSQVQYWEPAKWIAKLRDHSTSQNLFLLKTDMTAGHSGTTGRFESLKEDALEYAFLLMLEGHCHLK